MAQGVTSELTSKLSGNYSDFRTRLTIESTIEDRIKLINRLYFSQNDSPMIRENYSKNGTVY